MYNSLFNNRLIVIFFVISLSLFLSFFSGSHDSGSYSLSHGRGLAPDRSWNGTLNAINLFPKLTCRFVIKKWFKTQRVDIKEQLNHGIRYFDLRTASDPFDNDLYFVHGLFGDKILTMLRSLRDFLDSNEREIVFLDFQHFHSVSQAQHITLINNLIQLFENKICPYVKYRRLDELTLAEMWSKKYQVIIFYRNDDLSGRYNELWPSTMLPNPWANTALSSKLIPFLWNGLSNRPSDTFFVHQAILTPSKSLVARNICYSLYSGLSKTGNQKIEEWLLEVKKTNFKPNIIMTDFVDYNDYVLVKRTILINYDYLDQR